MKVLVDTNVILDVLLKRAGLYTESFAVFRLLEQDKITGCVSSSAHQIAGLDLIHWAPPTPPA
jgi:predicted nucleic acid-binding protein